MRWAWLASTRLPSRAMLVLGRSVGLHHVMKVEYSDGMLVAHLPNENILFAGEVVKLSQEAH